MLRIRINPPPDVRLRIGNVQIMHGRGNVDDVLVDGVSVLGDDKKARIDLTDYASKQYVADYVAEHGAGVEYGAGLKLEGGVLTVDTADAVEQDNTKPVTSAAVHTEIGNIEVLLAAL